MGRNQIIEQKKKKAMLHLSDWSTSSQIEGDVHVLMPLSPISLVLAAALIDCTSN